MTGIPPRPGAAPPARARLGLRVAAGLPVRAGEAAENQSGVRCGVRERLLEDPRRILVVPACQRGQADRLQRQRPHAVVVQVGFDRECLLEMLHSLLPLPDRILDLLSMVEIFNSPFLHQSRLNKLNKHIN